MSKFSLTTVSVYYRQNPLKTNVADCIAPMVAELLRTRRLVRMIIKKGKPKSLEDNPSECSWGAGAQTATACNKKLTRLGLGLLTFYILVHHAGP
jgi:hypothetical protein